MRRSTQQFSITLPNEMAGMVKSMVSAGLARERAMEQWLLEQVGPAYDALKADPSRIVSTDKVRARIAAEHQAVVGKGK